MKRAAGLVFASIFAASLASAATYYALQVKGGSRVYAVDEPVRKGRVMLFHRYPDGIYTSLTASEVEKVILLKEPPPPAGGLAPGQEVYIGAPLSGPNYVAPPAAAPQAVYVDPGNGYGYGYTESYWGGGYVPPRPPVPPPPPSHIGSNGFPILAPPGSPGSVQPPIGANGFPILAPQPAPAPRRP
jgi:hypothetical protein